MPKGPFWFWCVFHFKTTAFITYLMRLISRFPSKSPRCWSGRWVCSQYNGKRPHQYYSWDWRDGLCFFPEHALVDEVDIEPVGSAETVSLLRRSRNCLLELPATCRRVSHKAHKTAIPGYKHCFSTEGSSLCAADLYSVCTITSEFTFFAFVSGCRTKNIYVQIISSPVIHKKGGESVNIMSRKTRRWIFHIFLCLGIVYMKIGWVSSLSLSVLRPDNALLSEVDVRFWALKGTFTAPFLICPMTTVWRI